MARNGGIFHKTSGPGQVGDDSRSSAKQNTAVGSGSRPTKSSIPLEDSAPSNPKTLDRNPPSPLK